MRTRTVLFAGANALGVIFGPDIAVAQRSVALPEVAVTVSRIGSGIVGTSTSVITAEEIARSPGATIQDVLAEQPGVQIQNLYGAAGGARTSVDIRGFGVVAPQNTLVMINGRRINDLDLDLVDFAAIPKNSIERIEITRGNSGAVLYGDNAVGGVINIVTKGAVGAPPSARIEGGFGSYGQREGALSAAGSYGPWSASAYGSALQADGYRRHNEFKETNGIGELRYSVDGFSAFLNVSGDDQSLNLPGARRVDAITGLNQLVADPRGATTPFNYAEKQGLGVTAGFARQVTDAIELVVDGGVRQKKQQAAYFGTFVDPSASDPMNYVDTTLLIASVTPRLNIRQNLFGMPARATLGVDVYSNDYDSDRGCRRAVRPFTALP